jgi:hypothetical protein
VNDGSTGYPWSTGDVLTAADLNAAIANAASIGAAAVGKVVASDQFLAKPDFLLLTGSVSWVGTTVTIAGYAFAQADVGKSLVMPAGGPGGAPQIVTIVGVSGGSATVNPAATVAFSNMTNVLGGIGAGPALITVTNADTGGSLVGDQLTVVATAIRPAVLQTVQTRVVSASIPADAAMIASITGTDMVVTSAAPHTLFPGGLVVGAGVAPGTLIVKQTVIPPAGAVAGPTCGPGTYTVSIAQTVASSTLTVSYAGSGGPPGPVLLRGTTGYGRRVVLSGNVNSGGSLDPTLSLDPVTGADPGAYWMDVEEPLGEAVRTDIRSFVLPGSWLAGGTTLTLNAAEVTPLIMPIIHPGATVFALDENGAPAFPANTMVDSIIDAPSMTIKTTQAAITLGTNNDITFTDNRRNIAFSATFTSGATTITFSPTAGVPTLPTGVRVGQTLFGPGLQGGVDPTVAGNTVITAIAGSTITISLPTTQAATTAVSLRAVPYLVGAVVKLNLGPAVLAFRDYGAYAGAPGTNGWPFPVTRKNRAGGQDATGILVTFTEGARTHSNFIASGTDSAPAINAWLNATRSQLAATSDGMEAVLRPGAYLALSSINARSMQKTMTLRASGVMIHSAIAGATGAAARAWDASGSGAYRMVGDIIIFGDAYFPPDIGTVFARTDVNNFCSNLTVNDVNATGWFKFAASCWGNMEASVVNHCAGNNAMPWSVTDPDVAHPNDKRILTPNFGRVIDGDNSYGYLDYPPLQTHGSYVGFTEDVGTSICAGGAVPFSVVGCGGYVNRRGYAASWSSPAIFLSKCNNSTLDIHCEAAGLPQAIFMWDRSNGGVSFNHSRFEDLNNFATDAIFAYDTLGKFGVPVAGFTAINSTAVIGTTLVTQQVFADHVPFIAGHYWFGDIAVGSILNTGLPHWFNIPDHREGRLLLGNSSTKLGADVLTVGSIAATGSIVAAGSITTTDWLHADLGLSIGPTGFPQGKLQFAGGLLTFTTPLSLPDGTVAVTAFPGDNDTSVATTAFVHAAVINAASGSPPVMDGVANAGTLAAYSRGDHVHPTDTSRLATSGGTIAGNVTVTGTTTLGAATATTPGTADNSTNIATTAFVRAQAATTTPIMDGAGAVGVSLAYARADHVHPIPFIPAVGTSTPVMDGVGNAGTVSNYARADHVHPTDTSRFPAAGGTINAAVPLTMINSGQIDAYVRNTGTGGSAGGVWLHLDGPASSARRRLVFETAGSARWDFGTNNLPESSGNVGSGLNLRGFNDDGTTSTIYMTILRQDGIVQIGAAAGVKLTGNLGFYGTAPIAKPAITGSRSANAALASLITQLAALGIITDSSTA